ncbi:GntR family transcriptional regulator [Neobacillus niacini]|uniref:GntR family transcriptional regulator n=1 Tax=Neobacillus niacini TaxID=86668 RepID=UPI00398395F2
MKEEKEIKRDQVIEYIFHAIKNGELETGQSLSERSISERLGLSRTPVREAFRQLESLGLIKLDPHKTVVVASMSLSRVEQLYQIREVLEGLGAKLIAEKQDKEAIKQLQNYLKEAEYAIEKKEIIQLSKINTEFHLTIAKGAHNVYLLNIMNMLQTHIGLFMSTSLSSDGRPEQNLQEHKMIVNAIVEGDSDLAESLAKYHVRRAYKNAILELQVDSKWISD